MEHNWNTADFKLVFLIFFKTRDFVWKFGWGGTTVKYYHSCPNINSISSEILFRIKW